jgi:hypothetical protein
VPNAFVSRQVCVTPSRFVLHGQERPLLGTQNLCGTPVGGWVPVPVPLLPAPPQSPSMIAQ